MKKLPLTTPEPNASSTWERLEDFVREHVQRRTLRGANVVSVPLQCVVRPYARNICWTLTLI